MVIVVGGRLGGGKQVEVKAAWGHLYWSFNCVLTFISFVMMFISLCVSCSSEVNIFLYSVMRMLL